MIYGLGAAFGWGTADLGAAFLSRRIGAFTAVVIAQTAGLVAIVALFAVVRPAWRATGTDVSLLAGNGVLVAAAYVSHYRALEIGPVALVTPIVAAYAIMPIALAVLLLGERLTGPLLAGSIVTIAGVVLTSTDPRQLGRTAVRNGRTGIPYAFASTLLFGVATFVMARAAQRMGWLPAIAVARVFTILALLPVAAVRRERLLGAGGGALAGGAAIGLVDAIGIASFLRGAEVGLVSLVTAVSATYPLVPAIGGVTLLGERPAISQGAGIVLVIGGLALLGLAS